MRLAEVRWGMCQFEAQPIRRLGDRTWLMRAMTHSPRTSIGTEVVVNEAEISKWFDGEPSPSKPDGGK